MSTIRFATARDLFEAFPSAAKEVAAEPTDDPATGFARKLVTGGNLMGAVSFCAYLLPRRMVVRWLCHCLRVTPGAAEDAALAAAEAWVAAPEDGKRRAALDVGMRGARERPSTWVALAAGWSGGSLGAVGAPFVPMPEHLTAQAARTALILASFRFDRVTRDDLLQRWVDGGLGLAQRASDGAG